VPTPGQLRDDPGPPLGLSETGKPSVHPAAPLDPEERRISMNSGTPVEVRVVRGFSASPERVFDAWLNPGTIGRWMFGPALRDEEVVRIAIDARPGGAFSFMVRRQGQEIDHLGRYLEIERSKRLVFTWGIARESEDGSRVIIDIVPMATGCELTLTHELHPDWADYAERTEQGWTRMLDALAALLDQGPGRGDLGA
jgi:uncharacterized protein YndB with AHSA1/START domain